MINKATRPAPDEKAPAPAKPRANENEETIAQIRNMIRELAEERDAMGREMKQLKKKLEETRRILQDALRGRPGIRGGSGETVEGVVTRLLMVLSDLAEMGVRIEIRKAPDPGNLTMITLSAGERHYRRFIGRDIFQRTETIIEAYEEFLSKELATEALKMLRQEAEQ